METGLKSWLWAFEPVSKLSVKFGCASKGSWYFAAAGKFISTGSTEYAVPFFFLSFFLALLIFSVSRTFAKADSPPDVVVAEELAGEPRPPLPFWWVCFTCSPDCKSACFRGSPKLGDSFRLGGLLELALRRDEPMGRLGELLRGEEWPLA